MKVLTISLFVDMFPSRGILNFLKDFHNLMVCIISNIFVIFEDFLDWVLELDDCLEYMKIMKITENKKVLGIKETKR